MDPDPGQGADLFKHKINEIGGKKENKKYCSIYASVFSKRNSAGLRLMANHLYSGDRIPGV